MSPPANGTVFTTLDPITISGVAHSDSGLASLTVTANGEAIYTTNWDGSTTEATWTTSWNPPEGIPIFSLEATVTNAVGGSFNDPAETILTVQAPSLHIEKSVSQAEGIDPGEQITYTITLSNNGTAEIQDVLVSDTLPVGVSGDDLSQTITLNAGQTEQFTIPVTVTAAEDTEVTNTATFSHTLQTGEAQAVFHTCVVDPVVQNGKWQRPRLTTAGNYRRL